jgi:LacI family transcriptional regulator
LNAARDANILDKLTIITTDLFDDLVPHIRTGAVVATIYQRPRTQGRLAFRMLREFLAEGNSPSHQFTLGPHLIIRGNLEFFLHRQSQESSKKKVGESERAPEMAEDLARSASSPWDQVQRSDC